MMQLVRWYQDVIVTKIFMALSTTSKNLSLPRKNEVTKRDCWSSVGILSVLAYLSVSAPCNLSLFEVEYI